MSNQAIIQHLESFIPLKGTEKALLEERLVSRPIKRKEKILIAGEVCKHYTFVAQGCFRMFGVDDKGFEHNIQFTAENEWIADIGSFHSQNQSQLNIEALEAGLVLQIKQQDLYFLYNTIPKLNLIFKVLIELKYIELQNRVLQNFSSTAEQRYLGFFGTISSP
ncbi:cyclic nucleotide-binding domain-containing protein [Algoriphagus boritolerans]|uniref:Crp/Fnr family transcriptional regulator n=1 Tax=Algoriphagus boritolerans TaxID=308111 RepID=UPI000B2A5709